MTEPEVQRTIEAVFRAASVTPKVGVSLPAPLDPFGLPGCMLRTAIAASHLVATSNLSHQAGCS